MGGLKPAAGVKPAPRHLTCFRHITAKRWNAGGLRRLIAIRKRFHAFGRGSFETLDPNNRRVLVFLRRYRDEVILCVNNLSRFAQFVELDLREFTGQSPLELWGNIAFPAIGELPYLLTLGPHNFLWFRLLPSDQLPPSSAPPTQP